MDEHTPDDSVAGPPVGTPTGWYPETDGWEHDMLKWATVHGVRLSDSGASHDSPDCFEKVWPSVNKSHRQSGGSVRPATSR